MEKHTASSRVKRTRSKFVNDKTFKDYAQPKMLEAAEDLLCVDGISEEAFLGAQAIRLINGVL